MPSVCNVLDFGAVGDSACDDTAAIQAALDAAGPGGKVYFPRTEGTYRITDTLRVEGNSHLEGESMNLQGSSTESGPRIQADFDGIAIDLKGGVTIEYLRLDGPGREHASSIGINADSVSSVTIQHVYLLGFGIAMNLRRIYYGHLNRTATWKNGIGLKIDQCYNLNIFGAKFHGTLTNEIDTPGGICIAATTQCLVNVYGGAIEGYSTGIHFDCAGGQLNLFGVYFETTTSDYSIGVFVPDAKNAINLYGCIAYLQKHRALVHFTPSGGGTFTASGNLFRGGRAGLGCYAYEWSPRHPGLRVQISGDQWNAIADPAVRYCPLDLPNDSLVDVPAGTPHGDHTVTTRSVRNLAEGAWFMPGTHSGRRRPALTDHETGAVMWDAHLGQLICWNGTAWVSADGGKLPR